MNSTFSVIFASFALAGIITACGSNDEKPEVAKEVLDPNSSLNTNFDGKIFSIPSPMQTALLLQEANAPFNESYLNSVDNVENYSTEMKRALNLGIYGTDLGYLAIYKQNSLSLKYLATIEKLTSKLGLEGAFDKEFMSRFEKNSTNQDSMMVIVSDAFKKSDNFLKSNDRKSVSALILVGGWIESLYLACAINVDGKNTKITERIGEQRETLATIIEILEKYNKKGSNDELIAQMTDLKVDFDKIVIDYEFVQPKTEPSKKLTTLRHKTTVKMDQVLLKSIYGKITSIRQKITA
ncbi:MAG: hypothetical protein A3D31_06865 [Candidatus Fluviicola riflensis]|nr:MAG: hypothetical protein CHH17_08145 [Candidatus Fluviicola riflensis]OGS79676.1 MAG: hypothetical protein A3D31_06865 [Candidatus Fluviicola riflensis]OGS87108.1 MAG: hypothetical protein A2724_06325 [Fluviicola sp. RIFCSPHIGHO2_01_FULL_43_53]OGS89897.1 MAG: hypothetical protein A3E30_03070 [Fluviicola sp. RIFCSPHIGHO2_12_FULL_43_24]